MSGQCERTGLERLMCPCPLCVNEGMLDREAAFSGYLLDGAADERAMRRMMDSLIVPTMPSVPSSGYLSGTVDQEAMKALWRAILAPTLPPPATYAFAVRSAQRLTFTPYPMQWTWAPGGTGWEPAIPSDPTSPNCHGEARTEPFVGYRCWRLGSRALVSVGIFGAPWRPGENVARDALGISMGASPGFWALRSLEQAIETYGEYGAWAIGAVEVYGKVVEHRDGWRGEKARILGLLWPSAVGGGLAHLAWLRTAQESGLLTPRMARRGRRLWQRWPRVSAMYGVPIFHSVEGLRSFAEEMGAESAK